MAIEEEFGIEIPDAEADEITTVAQGELGSWYVSGSGAHNAAKWVVLLLIARFCGLLDFVDWGHVKMS
jgi:hypothetical protein